MVLNEEACVSIPCRSIDMGLYLPAKRSATREQTRRNGVVDVAERWNRLTRVPEMRRSHASAGRQNVECFRVLHSSLFVIALDLWWWKKSRARSCDVHLYRY